MKLSLYTILKSIPCVFITVLMIPFIIIYYLITTNSTSNETFAEKNKMDLIDIVFEIWGWALSSSKNTKRPSEQLFKLTKEMCDCNNIKILDSSTWPDNIGFSYDTLNSQAKSLPDSKINDFVDGETLIRQIIINVYGLHALDLFLNSVFDGILSEKITCWSVTNDLSKNQTR